MKSLISIFIVLLLGMGELATAETDEERAELLRTLEELRARHEQWKVVLVNKGTGWVRYRFNDQDLVIDAVNGIDLSDQKTVDRIIESVRTIRRYGKTCDVVLNFWYKRVPVSVGRSVPKSRTACEGGCYQISYREELKYGERKKYINISERCSGDF